MRGRRPTAHGRAEFQRPYAFGFVHPAGGRDLELLPPAADADWTARAPAEFARWADPADGKLLVLPVDDAGWHTAKRLPIPPNVVLHPLPSCTPQSQPAEPLWPLVREAAANRGFEELQAVP